MPPKTRTFARRRLAAALAMFAVGTGVLFPVSTRAEQLSFGTSLERAGWETVQFAFLSRAKFEAAGDYVRIRTEGTGALIWKALPESLRAGSKANWIWAADQAVPATDLTRKGGDDRVISVYFLYGGDGDVGKSATQLLRSESTRAVVYTFGSDVKRGTILPSPHMQERGKFIVLRSVKEATGKVMKEIVDLEKDYARLFGTKPERLLGVAISSDSDDTGGVNVARVGQIIVSQ